MEKKSKRLSGWFMDRPKLSGLITLLFLLALIFLIVRQRYELFQENKKRELDNILTGVKQNLDQSLNSSYTVALTLALTLDHNGVPKNFDEVAKQLIYSNPNLQAVQLVPNGVVKYIYPLVGNEAVLNLDLKKSPAGTIVETNKAIKTRKMYFQGPVKLTQGGTGVVGRLPLYIDNKFWGFSAVVIRLDTLFRNAGIDNKRFKDYRFQFSKVNPITKKEEFFLPTEINTNTQRVKSVYFPEGDWRLYVINVNQFDTWFELISAVLFGLSTAVLSSYLITRLIRKHKQLQQIIDDQASQILDTESKFKNIFDYAAVGIARVDSISGEILEINQYFCEFLGYTAGEIMGKKIKSVIYPDDLPEDRSKFKALLKGEIREFSSEKRYLSKEGKASWGSVIITPLWKEGDEPSTHIVIVEDITKRKLEEQVLVSSQQRIESLINTIDGIVWEGNPSNHTCTFISQKVYDILGYTPNQWMTVPNFWFDHIHPSDQEWVRLYTVKATAERRQRDFEYRMIANDGSIVWIRDIVTVIDEVDQPVKFRGIMIDITNKKHAEDALNKSFNLVTEQNKRLLNFSHIVSHNLRSHASNILGISVLISSAKNEVDRNEMIELLKKVADNLNETLYNLNNIVNIQTSINILVEPLNLYEYVLTALATQNAQILFKEATILNKINEDIVVNYNRAYLESILLNLISNALRYNHPDRKPVISLTCFEENGQLVLRVSDNGVGIDLTKHGEKMFGIYQTFNGNSDARGFGLFITKNQIEAMGGKIAVESTIGNGTTFKVYFK